MRAGTRRRVPTVADAPVPSASACTSIFPAFYTDVTDSYRLSRAGRLRTDLGGLYFNVLCLIVLASLYLTTGNGLFLLAAFVMHVEMVQQLIPIIRLDGYYVLADLAGVPDLFAQVGPVLRSLRPGAERDPRVAELRPRARRTVIAWVCFVVPTLLIGTLWLLWNLPFIIRTNIDAIRMQAMQWTAARDAGDVATVALASISILLLAVPLLGIAVLLDRLVRFLWRLVSSQASRTGSRRDRSSNEETPMTLNQPPLSLQHNGTSHDSPSTPRIPSDLSSGHPGIGHQAQVEPRPADPLARSATAGRATATRAVASRALAGRATDQQRPPRRARRGPRGVRAHRGCLP